MEVRLIKNTQKATTEKWRQCNRLREKQTYKDREYRNGVKERERERQRERKEKGERIRGERENSK